MFSDIFACHKDTNVPIPLYRKDLQKLFTITLSYFTYGYTRRKIWLSYLWKCLEQKRFYERLCKINTRADRSRFQELKLKEELIVLKRKEKSLQELK